MTKKSKDKFNLTIPGEATEAAAIRVAETVFGAAADGTVSIVGNIFGGLIGDRIREWRTRNLINVLAKTAEHLKKQGVPLEKARGLPMGEAYIMFENASTQDDSLISEMWGKLISEAMNPSRSASLDRTITSVLTGFSPSEAMLFAAVSFLGLKPCQFHEFDINADFIASYQENRSKYQGWVSDCRSDSDHEDFDTIEAAAQSLMSKNLIVPRDFVNTHNNGPDAGTVLMLLGTLHGQNGALEYLTTRDFDGGDAKLSTTIFMPTMLGSIIGRYCLPDNPKWLPQKDHRAKEGEEYWLQRLGY